MSETVLPRAYQEIEALIARTQWQDAVVLARRRGSEALAEERFALARNIGGLLERLQDYRHSAHLMSASMRLLETPCPLPEWDGSDLGSRTLLVISRNKHVGNVLRFSRLLGLVAGRARRCIVLAEPRLIPLFRRSFPTIELWDAGVMHAKAYEEADVVASYETLIKHIGVKEDGQIAELPPLRPDPDKVDGFRDKYRRAIPTIGICWHSTNEKKDLANLGQWAAFIRRQKAAYISVQYGDVRADVEQLRQSSGREVIYDETVDSLRDLDGFAAQIASLDAVVTISNTGAHMAGALNVPMFVLLDDKDHLMWPFTGSRTGWYPSARLYRKANRPWIDVFEDIRRDINGQVPRDSGAETRKVRSQTGRYSVRCFLSALSKFAR